MERRGARYARHLGPMTNIDKVLKRGIFLCSTQSNAPAHVQSKTQLRRSKTSQTEQSSTKPRSEKDAM